MKRYVVLKSTSIFTGTCKKFLNGYVVMQDQTIVGVYSLDELPEFIRQTGKHIDCGDNTILPGFIEAHSHVQLSALLFHGMIQQFSGTSEEDCVKQLLQRLPEANLINGWLVGKGWYLPNWFTQQLPTKASLDAAFPTLPIMLISDDLHTIWLNSQGLKELEGFFSLKPEDVIRDSGEPSGVIKEKTAMACMNHVLTLSVSERAQLCASYLKDLASKGYTAVCDLALLPAEDTVDCDDQIYPEVYQLLADQEQLPVRMFLFPFFDLEGQRVKQLRRQFAGPRLSIAGGKQFFDGVISSQTAWLKEAYETESHSGAPIVAPKILKRMIERGQREQIPLRIHCIGDQASSQALQYFIEAQKKWGALLKGYHSLEHLERIEKTDISALKEAQIVASVQPSHPLLDYQKAEKDLGERSDYMWPVKDMADQGVPLAFGSDSPVVQGIGPLDNVYYAMTRQTKAGHPRGGWQPEQRLDICEALLAHTSGASKACCQEDRIGTLEPGKQADIVIVEGNLATCPVNEIPQRRILATIIEGNINDQMKEGMTNVKRAGNF